MEDIKHTVRGIVFDAAKNLTLGTLPLRQPSPNEVVVRIHSAPINPSDTNFCSGSPFYKKDLPTFPGFEGSGVVVKTGTSDQAKELLGKKVALFPMSSPASYGTWSEYTTIDINFVYPLIEGISLEDASSSIVNPMTGQALINDVREAGHKSIIIGAASSSLGKMLIALSKKYGITTLCLVRNPSHIEPLKSIGADFVLSSAEDSFKEDVRKTVIEAKSTAYLDPVTGSEGAFVSALLPPGSLTVIYGRLSKEDYILDTSSLLFNQNTIVGFILGRHLSDGAKGLAIAREALENIRDKIISSKVVKKFEIEEYQQALEYVKSNPASDGKVIIYNKNFSESILD